MRSHCIGPLRTRPYDQTCRVTLFVLNGLVDALSQACLIAMAHHEEENDDEDDELELDVEGEPPPSRNAFKAASLAASFADLAANCASRVTPY